VSELRGAKASIERFFFSDSRRKEKKAKNRDFPAKKMTLTCDQSEHVFGEAQKRKSADSPKLDPLKKARRTSEAEADTKMSQVETEFRVLQSLIPQIAGRKQLSEVRMRLQARVRFMRFQLHTYIHRPRPPPPPTHPRGFSVAGADITSV
jgi:hypothetical protein